MLLVTGFLTYLLARQLFRPATFEFALNTQLYPLYCVSYLEEHPKEGVLFNSYEFGGYLAWRDLKPFISGMTGTYGANI